MTEREKCARALNGWVGHLRTHGGKTEKVMADDLERVAKFLEDEQKAVERFIALMCCDGRS